VVVNRKARATAAAASSRSRFKAGARRRALDSKHPVEQERQQELTRAAMEARSGVSDYYQRMARFEPRRLLRLAQAGEEVGARAVQIAQEKLRGRS
jgi:hypothetical protein